MASDNCAEDESESREEGGNDGNDDEWCITGGLDRSAVLIDGFARGMGDTGGDLYNGLPFYAKMTNMTCLEI